MIIIEGLKKETKSAHQQVEKVLVKELKNIQDINDYGKLLVRLYDFYKPLEDAIHDKIDATVIPDISERKHAHRIINDLTILNFELPIAPTTSILNIDTTSYALGVLYVMEGSTLGGQFISKMINAKMEGFDATNYFGGYDQKNMEMWTAFKNYITLNEDTIDRNQIFQGAEDTFKTLEDWLIKTSSLENINA